MLRVKLSALILTALLGVGQPLTIVIHDVAIQVHQLRPLPAWIAPVSTDIIVNAGGNLQAALNSAVGGDNIILQAGAEFVGSFSLPNKSGSTYITVKSSALSNLPAGVRVSPAQVGSMATIRTNSPNGPAVFTQTSSHHWRFQGIEFETTTGVASDGGIVRLGSNPKETSLSQITHDFDFDRCYVHGQPTQNVQQGFVLNAQDATVQNSYVSDIHYVGTDSQAILSYNSPGGIHIVNNYLEGAGENILFGGADPGIPNLVPGQTGGIEIRRNLIFKPLSWKVGDPSYAGIHWTVKNLLELKNAKNVVVDGNIFQNCWTDGQVGIPILFTVRNQEGTAPWSIIENVSFTNNTISGTLGTFNLLGSDNEKPSQRCFGLTISNNLIFNVSGNPFLTMNGYNGVSIIHNTEIRTSGNTTTLYSTPSTGFVYRDNLQIETLFGIFGEGGLLGTPALDQWTPGYVFTKNVAVGAPAGQNPAGTCGGITCYPATVSTVQFVNFAGGDYALLPSSPYHNAATDGTDIGVNMPALLAAQSSAALPTTTIGGSFTISGKVTLP